MWLVSIIPLEKSVNLWSIDNEFRNVAAVPSTRDATASINEKITRIAIDTTAATIWLPDRDDPSMPMDKAAAPCNTKPK